MTVSGVQIPGEAIILLFSKEPTTMMMYVCNPTPESVKEEDAAAGIVRTWQRDERVILVNPEYIVAVHKDYYDEGYHLVSVSNGKSVASDLLKREKV